MRHFNVLAIANHQAGTLPTHCNTVLYCSWHRVGGLHSHNQQTCLASDLYYMGAGQERLRQVRQEVIVDKVLCVALISETDRRIRSGHERNY